MVTPGQLNRRAQLYEQLAAMIAAGLPLPKALEMAGRNRSLYSSQKVIQTIVGYLHEGLTFGDSLKKVQGWLPEFDIALMTAGEHSGQLDASFKLLARYYASQAKIIRDTIAGLFVTVATLHVFLLIMPLALFVSFAMGIINNDFSLCIPFLIEKAAVFGGIYGIIFFLVFACQGHHGESWRAKVESIFGMIPVLRTAIKYLALARLSLSLDALLNAGVPVVRSWEFAGAASGSPRLKREILQWAPQLEAGVTPGEMVNQIHYFPEMFANLFNSGEISGRIDETLGRLRVYFEEEGFRNLQIFAKGMNAIIYGSVMVIVALYIINFWIHYYGAAMSSINGI